MKSLGTYSPPETVGLQFIRLATPFGRELPRAPVPGELFTLEADMPEPKVPTPWFPRGMYAFNGTSWQKVSDAARQRKTAPIGSQKITVEEAGKLGDVPPPIEQGYGLTAISIVPSNRKAAVSGTASFWVDLTASPAKGGYVWVSIYRGKKLVSIAVEWIDCSKPKTMSMSFLDLPGVVTPVAYEMKIDTDVIGTIYVNQCSRFTLDGMAQTAFTVAEDN